MLLITKGCCESILTSRNKEKILALLCYLSAILKNRKKREQLFSHFLAKCSFPGHHVCRRANTVIIVPKYRKTSLRKIIISTKVINKFDEN